jgi:hypothetical protein
VQSQSLKKDENNAKKVAKIFGGFRYFLYLCTIIKSGSQTPGVAAGTIV